MFLLLNAISSKALETEKSEHLNDLLYDVCA